MDNRILLGPRVLLVEDQAIVMMSFKNTLADIGCEMLTASNLTEALALAQAEEFDCAVLDIDLCGEAAYPVADVIRRRGIPVIISTGYSLDSLPEEYRAHAVLSKPFSAGELKAAVGNIVELPVMGSSVQTD